MADNPIDAVAAPISNATGISKKVLTVVVIGAVAYFAWMWWQKRRAMSKTPTATSVPSQAPGAPNANGGTSSATGELKKSAVIA